MAFKKKSSPRKSSLTWVKKQYLNESFVRKIKNVIFSVLSYVSCVWNCVPGFDAKEDADLHDDPGHGRLPLGTVQFGKSTSINRKYETIQTISNWKSLENILN